MKKADVVEHLIRKAEKYVKIKQVLFDGGFYEVSVIERLKKLRVKYIIRADKSKRLNRRLKRANKERSYRVS